MVTLVVYFEHISILYQSFIKYNVAILQVYQSYIIILLKIITNDIYYSIILHILINYIIIKKLIRSLI
jgi:hypothetical protein